MRAERWSLVAAGRRQLRGPVVLAALLVAATPARALAQLAPEPRPPAPPPATPGPECADPRVGGACDDPARLARLEAFRAEDLAAMRTEKGIILGAGIPTALGATGLGIYALTAREQPTGYYVGAGVATGLGGLIIVSFAIALLPSSEPPRQTTRAWEAALVSSDQSSTFALTLAAPVIISALVAVPAGVWIMADDSAAPTAPDGRRIALGASIALLGGFLLVGTGVGIAQSVRNSRIVRTIEPPRRTPSAFVITPTAMPLPGGAAVGLGGLWL